MKRILVVDDSTTVRLYHKWILENAGYEVDEAENGMEALEKASQKEYNLFLIDINMPILDGYSFVKRYRQNHGYDTSIIMISTEAQESDKITAYKVGANFYQVKPVTKDDLIFSTKLLVIDK